MLKAVKPEVLLLRSEATQDSQVNIMVNSHNIGIAMMNDIVLPLPNVGTATHQI